MPYFYEIDTGEILFNKHSMNARVIDGEIIEIPEDELCLLVTHIPTAQFN